MQYLSEMLPGLIVIVGLVGHMAKGSSIPLMEFGVVGPNLANDCVVRKTVGGIL